MWPLSSCHSASSHKISPKSENRSMSYGYKSDFEDGDRRHLEFQKFQFLPAGLRVAQPCRYCFYSLAQKWVFRPAGATRCPDKRENWHEEADRRSAPSCQLSRLSGQKCGNTAPKTAKILNFGQKFVPQGRLICNFFLPILSVWTRL